MTSVYWWRLPDGAGDEAMLMGLRHAELKVYLVVARAIQRDRNKGRLSIRQIAERAQLNPKHAHAAVTNLVERGLLVCGARPSVTAVYRLPSEWRNCTPTGEQFEVEPEAPGGQNCVPEGEQNCTPPGEQHLEFLEFSELSPSSDELSRSPEKTVDRATTNAPPRGDAEPVRREWAETETEQAREAMRQHFGVPLYPDIPLTTEVLAHMLSAEDVRCWLLDLASRRVKPRSWGFYRSDAATWPTRRSDVSRQVENARIAREQREADQARDFAAPAAAMAREMDTTVLKIEDEHHARPILVPPHCVECQGKGIREAAEDPAMYSWCECPAGERRRIEAPDLVDQSNARVLKLRQQIAPPAESVSAVPVPRGAACVERKTLMRAGDMVPVLPALLAARKV